MYKINFEKMSEETNIPIGKIKAVCCHPIKIPILKKKLDKAKTLEEVKKVYRIIPTNSEIEKEAIMKLAKFYEE